MLRDLGDGATQLHAAIAAQRSQEIAGEAFGVQADQHRFGGIDLADDDGKVLLAAIARPPRQDAGILGAFERHMCLCHLLQVARRRFLVRDDIAGIDVDEILFARPVAPVVAGIAAERPQDDGGQQARELGELDCRLGNLRGVAGDRPRQVTKRDMAAGILRLVRPQDDVDRHALGQVERDRLVGLAHAARDMGRDVHADRFGAAPRRHQHGGVLGQTLQALQGARAAGFGGNDQPTTAILAAQHDDAAAAQLGHGALDGGDCRCGARVNGTGTHASIYHAGGILLKRAAFVSKSYRIQ